MTELLGAGASAVIQIVLLLAISPAVSGLIKTAKARLQGRRGPPVGQPYSDLLKLLRKDMVVADSASWVFRWAPAVAAAAVAVAALLVPAPWAPAPLAAWGDAITFVGLFALARFALALAGLDTGSAYGGIGSSREVAVAALAEPALLLGLFAVAARTGDTDLSAMSGWIATHGTAAISPSQLLAFVAIAAVVIAETGRLPVDNPDTHLELTMLHEGMLLEYSGRALGILTWASHLKQTALFALVIALFVPSTTPATLADLPLALGSFAAKLVAIALAVAVFESATAKLRILRVPGFLGTASAIAALALVTELLLP